jgi:hypothetical protein
MLNAYSAACQAEMDARITLQGPRLLTSNAKAQEMVVAASRLREMTHDRLRVELAKVDAAAAEAVIELEDIACFAEDENAAHWQSFVTRELDA